MASINNINSYNSANNIFSSVLGKGKASEKESSSNVASLSSLLSSSSGALSDLSMINNGSYKKLLNAYYDRIDNPSEQIDKTEKLNLSKANSDASALTKAIGELRSIDIENADTEKVKDTLKNFVDSYNKVIDSGSEVDNTNVLRNVLWMTQGSSANASVLMDLGISITDGNKLKLDESKVDKLSKPAFNSVVGGFGSFMSRLEQRSESIAKAAVNAVGLKTASAYSSDGKDYKSEISPQSVIDSKL